jgi:hypothetical protein
MFIPLRLLLLQSALLATWGIQVTGIVRLSTSTSILTTTAAYITARLVFSKFPMFLVLFRRSSGLRFGMKTESWRRKTKDWK